MPKIDYLLIGHLTADLIQNERILGGTVSYAAPVAAAFGHRVGMLTSAAACEPLLEPLHAVSAELMVRLSHQTTTFELVYEAGGRRLFVHDTADPLQFEDIPNGWLDAPLVHLAPLVNEVDPRIAAQFANSTVMLTPQGYLRQWSDDHEVRFRRWLDEEMLRHVDILVLSEHDVAAAPDLIEAYAQIVPVVLLTMGERGGMIYQNGQRTTYEAVRVQETEPTGAGDVFAAAVLSALLSYDHELSLATRTAAYLAAQSVRQKGAPAFTDVEIAAARDYTLSNDAQTPSQSE